MARIGFSIGKGLNKALRFAAGAGAFESIGKGNKAAGLAKDLTGLGSNVDTGSTLSDRVRGGFSAISPTFAQAENLRSAQESRETTTAINKETLRQARFDNTLVNFDDQLPEGVEDETRAMLKARAQSAGILQTSADGTLQLTNKDKREGFAQLSDDTAERQAIFNSQIQGIQRRTKANEALKQNSIDKLMEKANGGTLEGLGMEAKKALEAEVIVSISNGTADKGLSTQYNNAVKNEEALSKNLATHQSQLEVEIDSQTTPLQKSQIELNEAKARAEGVAGRFESTKTFETLARGMFDGKSVSELTPKEVDAVVRRKLKEDPEQRKQTMDLRKEFNAIPIVQQFESTVTRFNQITSILDAANEGTLTQRNAVDQVLINNFNKMMDEASVVRESEYARTPAGVRLTNRLKGFFLQKVQGGSGLTDEDRAELREGARILNQEFLASARQKADQYRNIAEKQGTDPSMIITNPQLRGGEVDEDRVSGYLNQ